MPASAVAFIPLHWGNLMQGDTYGLESWADWQVTDKWRLSPGVRLLHKSLRFTSAASGLLGVAQAGDDPLASAQLKSSLDFGPAITFDATLRYVDSLPNPVVPCYFELNARLGWHASRTLELSLSGANLLHARHYEYAPPDGEEITRSVFAEARWNF